MQRLEEVAREAAAIVGRGGFDVVRLVGGSTSSAYRAGDVVLIVAPKSTLADALSARVNLAAALPAGSGLVRPLEGLAQPLWAKGRLVTAWEHVEISPGPIDWSAVGAAVRSLHNVPRDVIDALGATLPRVGDLSELRRRINALCAAGRLSQQGAEVLTDVADRLAAELSETTVHEVLLHGDLHRPNLLATLDGVVLCDVDELCVGPAAYDLGFLTDPGRPTLPPLGPARGQFEAGYGARLPPIAYARTMARLAHLRRTVSQLSRMDGRPRTSFYHLLRVASWEATLRDWDADLHPVVSQTRRQKIGRVARRIRREGLTP